MTTSEYIFRDSQGQRYVIPKIKYTNKINDKLTLNSSVGYEILSYDYNKRVTEWDNNQVEVIAGFNYVP